MTRYICITLIASLICINAYAATNDSQDSGSTLQCGQLAKECFSNGGIKRTNCFYSVANHAFCEGTEIGKLIYKRWTLAANSTVDGKTPPGLMGPSVYDENCLAKVDNQWLGELVQDNVKPESIKEINQKFDQCRTNGTH